MKKFTKVRVSFGVESLLDFDQILHELQLHYAIGFAGLCKGDQGIWLYIQRDINTKTCMTLGKIRKICSKVAAVVEVEPFNIFEEELIESYGAFRHVGARGHLRERSTDATVQSNTESNMESKNTTTTSSHNNTTTSSHNTTTTSSHINSNNTTHLHLHINALGKEDTSHITKETLEDFIGTPDQVARRLDGLYNMNSKLRILKKKWASFRMYARQKVRRWDKQEKSKDPDYKCMGEPLNIKSPTPESEADDNYESEGEILEKPPVYDPDSDSETNTKRKQKLLKGGLLEEYPNLRKEEFLRDFEDWIYENPHNSNVIASTKEGYFKYFDGKGWIKLYNKRFFKKVTLSRIKKMDELLHNLVDEGELSEFCREQVSEIVNELFVDTCDDDEMKFHLADHTETTKDGILAAENQGARLTSVEKSIQRLIVRVGKMTTRDNVVRNSTWENLENL